MPVPVTYTAHAYKRLEGRNINRSGIKKFIADQKVSLTPVMIDIPDSTYRIGYVDSLKSGRQYVRKIITVIDTAIPIEAERGI